MASSRWFALTIPRRSWAKRLVDGYDVELWSRAQLLIVLKHKPEVEAGSVSCFAQTGLAASVLIRPCSPQQNAEKKPPRSLNRSSAISEIARRNSKTPPRRGCSLRTMGHADAVLPQSRLSRNCLYTQKISDDLCEDTGNTGVFC